MDDIKEGKKKQLELSLTGFNYILSSRGIELEFIGHKQSEEFESFSKFALGLNFRCTMKGNGISFEGFNQILEQLNIRLEENQSLKLASILNVPTIPDFIENPQPSGLASLRRNPQFVEKKDGEEQSNNEGH